jgi:dTDP-4-dehydrorhamnose reductase
VINAAAFTDVDRAEQEVPTAVAVNTDGPKQLALETGRLGIPLIHISTDYVFDGKKGAPYAEEDREAPLNVYGRSKLDAEREIRKANLRHVILRTSWVFSPHRRNFVKTILRLAKTRGRLTIVADQRGCPTGADSIANVCLDIASRSGLDANSGTYGTYHFAGMDGTTWFDFARAIVEIAGPRLGRSPEVVPIKSNEYPTPAIRPHDTRLNCSKILRVFGIKQPAWHSSLEKTIDHLLESES